MKTVPSTPTGTHTVSSVLAFLESQLESNEPDAVLAVLVERNGKPLTKRLLAKLPGGEAEWRLSQTAGMFHLETRNYGRSDGNTGIHLLIAYQITNVMIDAAWIEEHNPAYFEGRRNRNALRDATMGDPVLLQSMADALNSYEAAKAKLDEAAVRLEALTGYGKAFSPDSCDWEKICGAREEKRS